MTSETPPLAASPKTNILRVLITGNRGFVGKETDKLLKEKGIEVIGFDIQNGNQDITDPRSVESAIRLYRPNRILHLAATARFSDARQNPERAVNTNYLGTEIVSIMARKYHIPLVYASTGTVYMPVGSEMPITEEFNADLRDITTPYGFTKRLGELAVMRYASPWIILRYGHLYGAEKRYHGLVGGIYSKIRAGQKPQIWGGEQTNDFAYVKDIAEANYKALTATWENWGEIYNIGTGIEISTKDAAKTICKIFGYKGEPEVTSARGVDPERFVYDISKAKHMIDFHPKWSFEVGLKDMAKELGNEKTLSKPLGKPANRQGNKTRRVR